MGKPAVIGLVTEISRTHGVHESVTDDIRTVYCTVRSVGRSEFYNALNAGIKPEYVFIIALAEDYKGERLLDYKGKRYRIVRAYEPEDGGIELTAERSDVNGETDDEDDAGDNSDAG